MANTTELATIDSANVQTGKQWIGRWFDTVDEQNNRINRFRIMAGPSPKRTKQFVEIKVGPTDTPESVLSRIQKNANNSRQGYVCVQALYAGHRHPTDTREWTELEDPDLGDQEDDDDKPTTGALREVARMLSTQISHNQFMIGQHASQTERMMSHLLNENKRLSDDREKSEEARLRYWAAAEDIEDKRAERERKARQTEALINGATNIGQSVLMYLAKGKASANAQGAIPSPEAQHQSTQALGQLLSTLDETQAATILGTLRADQQTLFLTMVQNAEYPQSQTETDDAETK